MIYVSLVGVAWKLVPKAPFPSENRGWPNGLWAKAQFMRRGDVPEDIA
jgi:hypothetical protein